MVFRKRIRLFSGAVLALCLIIGCGGESPESLFETARFEERQTNVARAEALYHRIIQEHPDSAWAKRAKERLAKPEKSAAPQ